MPSTSGKQHRLMALVANNSSAAKRLGIPQSVGEDFMKADKGRKFGSGGRPDIQKINKPKTDHGTMSVMKKGGEVKESKAQERAELAFMKSKGAPKSMIKHEESEMKSMKKGGFAKTAGTKVTAGGIKKFGEHTVQQKGHTRGKNMGDSGKSVGIQSGAKGMKRGGKC